MRLGIPEGQGGIKAMLPVEGWIFSGTTQCFRRRGYNFACSVAQPRPGPSTGSHEPLVCDETKRGTCSVEFN